MYSNATAKMLETIEKLSRLTMKRGATQAEAATAQRKIKIIQAKLAILNTPKPDIPRSKPWVWKTKGEQPTLDPTPATPTPAPAATAKPAKPTPPPEQTIFPNYADLQNRYRV